MTQKQEYILHNAAMALPSNIWPEPVQGFALKITDGKISDILSIAKIHSESCAKIDLGGGILSAGFIDVQVNGGGGVLLNDAPSEEAIKTISMAHAKYGTTSMLPTLITDDFAIMEAAIEATDRAIAAGNTSILGIHLEGPFLSSHKKGVHDESKFKIIDAAAIELVSSLKYGKTLITLAPENAPIGAIHELVKRGIIVSGGHSNATFAQVLTAIKEGLSGFTHLFNAMSQISAREPNMVGAALGSANCFSGIIADMVHVHAQNIAMAHKLLGAKSLMLVTDAMSCIGTDATEFELYGNKIMVRDGSCFDEHGTLAGSALDMANAVRNAHKRVGLPLGQCLQLASETPARFLGVESKIGALRIGLDADLVHLDDDLRVQNVWLKGAQTRNI
ncbi:MAG: N-acetylglucosamine-6-phosphate deacetylase [Hyphomonadaceae bacterium]|nr:MAG: N-acetylglucosamine-6-phosphate deacetylase [Hyphomonadaceae bacterium]KAF0183938.1 MAG: N-acetylglucosamine-6-phosphate deacetylase [Hyphomonadaceae bacterium]